MLQAPIPQALMLAHLQQTEPHFFRGVIRESVQLFTKYVGTPSPSARRKALHRQAPNLSFRVRANQARHRARQLLVLVTDTPALNEPCKRLGVNKLSRIRQLLEHHAHRKEILRTFQLECDSQGANPTAPHIFWAKVQRIVIAGDPRTSVLQLADRLRPAGICRGASHATQLEDNAQCAIDCRQSSFVGNCTSGNFSDNCATLIIENAIPIFAYELYERRRNIAPKRDMTPWIVIRPYLVPKSF